MAIYFSLKNKVVIDANITRSIIAPLNILT